MADTRPPMFAGPMLRQPMEPRSPAVMTRPSSAAFTVGTAGVIAAKAMARVVARVMVAKLMVADEAAG